MVTRDAEPMVSAVRQFADRMLEDARIGSHGLLVDAVDADTGDPVAVDTRDVVEGRLLCNFISQQEFLRTLVGLSTMTGDSAYREAAERLVSTAFEVLADSSGLLHWGGHDAFDLEAGNAIGQPDKTYHELKADYPYYDLFWTVDPGATRRFIEAFWEGHVLDWAELDFNRHAEFGGEVDAPWSAEFVGEEVFFWGDGLTFANTGSDLFFAAGVLSDLSGDERPLEWAEHLASRYVDTRQETGIAGYQFSQHPSYCNGPSIRGDRAQYQFAPYITGDHLVYEGTLFRPRPYVQERQLVLGDRLGGRGGRFTRWALDELQAWREAAYRPSENTFEPMLTDGYSLEGFVIRREGYFGPKGRVIGPIEADASVLVPYATAYRTTGAPFSESMVTDILSGMGFDSIDTPLESGAPDLTVPVGTVDLDLLYSFVELYRATGLDPFAEAAASVAESILAEQFRDGYFVEDGIAKVGDSAALAVLTAAAAISDRTPVASIPLRGDRPGVPPGGI